MKIGLLQDHNDELHHARVKRRAIVIDYNPVGQAHDNPLFDSRRYVVEFDGGILETISANVIEENILAQVDDCGHRHLLLSEIIDHRSDNTVIPIEKSFTTTKSGGKQKVRITQGWKLCV